VTERAQFPMQSQDTSRRNGMRIGRAVYLRAYEVYSHVFSPQPALLEGGCRGGMHYGEIIAFLYAYPFPKQEWKQRFEEALEGMRIIPS
jgi:hypothetical protein